METRTFSPVTRANQAKQKHRARLRGEAHPGPAFVSGLHSSTGPGPRGWAARIPASIQSAAFWPFTVRPQRGPGLGARRK